MTVWRRLYYHGSCIGFSKCCCYNVCERYSQNEIDNFWKELLLRDFNIEDYVYYTKKKNFFQKSLRKVERAFLLKPSRDILKNYYKEKFKNFYLARDKSNLELFKRIMVEATTRAAVQRENPFAAGEAAGTA